MQNQTKQPSASIIAEQQVAHNALSLHLSLQTDLHTLQDYTHDQIRDTLWAMYQSHEPSSTPQQKVFFAKFTYSIISIIDVCQLITLDQSLITN